MNNKNFNDLVSRTENFRWHKPGVDSLLDLSRGQSDNRSNMLTRVAKNLLTFDCPIRHPALIKALFSVWANIVARVGDNEIYWPCSTAEVDNILWCVLHFTFLSPVSNYFISSLHQDNNMNTWSIKLLI